MKGATVLARVLVVLSVVAFLGSIYGLIYWRWIHTVTSMTAAWSNALSTFEVGTLFATFLAVIATYLRAEATR